MISDAVAAVPWWFWALIGAWAGGCAASFAACVAGRGWRGAAHGRSVCDHCDRQLAWFENVPVVSWLALRGRCRTCRGPVPPTYVTTEVMCAAAAGVAGAMAGPLAAVVVAAVAGTVVGVALRRR